MKPQPLDSIETVLEVDSKTRQLALSWIISHNITS